jgi:hypothetical protein
MNNWIEGEDFYYNEQGFIVLTSKYHLDRGHCCGNGCRHCPYEKPPQTSRIVGTGSPEEGLKSSK